MTVFQASVRQGIDWLFDLTATSGGVPIDITGWSIELEVRNWNAVSELILTVGSGVTITDGAAGEMSFRATAAQTLAIDEGTHDFNVKASPGGSGAVVYEWLVGVLRVSRELA